MNIDFAGRAIERMRAPKQMHIICVDVTNKCDLKCSNCTRLLANQDTLWDMSLDNFRAAVRSLREFPGVIAVIGGNPCMHRDFESLCEIITEEIPDKRRRGLWTNNAFKFAELAEQTFGMFNLNPHGVARGVASLARLKKLGIYYEGHSEHSSLLAAIKDFHEPEEMWEKIANCDINKNWSATVVENKGKLRAYFCEVAGSFDLARGTDNGIEVTDGWWKKPLQEFSQQIRHFCPGCGVAAKIKGHMDHEEIDTYSRSNADLAEKSAATKGRKIVEVKREEQVAHTGHAVTTYSTNVSIPAPAPKPLRVGVITPYYKESLEMLKACHDSVAAQTYPCTHYMVADGHPRPEIAEWNAVHIALPSSHGDNGNHARWVGSMEAVINECQAVAFLDADNWFAPEHIATLVDLHRTSGAAICTTTRTIHHLDGTFLLDCPEIDGKTFVDTSCLLCTTEAFPLLGLWGTMPKKLGPLCDRIFWTAVQARGFSTAHAPKATVRFRSQYRIHYEWAGVTAPPGLKEQADLTPVGQAWNKLSEDHKWLILEGHSDAAGRIYEAGAATATRMQRARDLILANKPGDAAALYLAVLRAEPLHAEALHNLAVAWHKLGRDRDAERLFRMAVAAEPENQLFRADLESYLAMRSAASK